MRISSDAISLDATPTRNIILVGMPGCGKSTVGKLAARWSGLRFVDADQEIVRAAGMPIPKIFEQEGESGFRERERKALEELCRQQGILLATGGGAILDERNRALLRASGTVVWLRRPIEELATRGRPLSANGLESLEAMAKLRYPLYEETAHACVCNRWGDSIGSIARQLLLAAKTQH